jgi:hypothetical protein
MKDKRPSDRVASDAGRELQNPKSSKQVKELAASIEANREPATKKGDHAKLVRKLIDLNKAKGR